MVWSRQGEGEKHLREELAVDACSGAGERGDYWRAFLGIWLTEQDRELPARACTFGVLGFGPSPQAVARVSTKQRAGTVRAVYTPGWAPGNKERR